EELFVHELELALRKVHCRHRAATVRERTQVPVRGLSPLPYGRGTVLDAHTVRYAQGCVRRVRLESGGHVLAHSLASTSICGTRPKINVPCGSSQSPSTAPRFNSRPMAMARPRARLPAQASPASNGRLGFTGFSGTRAASSTVKRSAFCRRSISV